MSGCLAARSSICRSHHNTIAWATPDLTTATCMHAVDLNIAQPLCTPRPIPTWSFAEVDLLLDANVWTMGCNCCGD